MAREAGSRSLLLRLMLPRAGSRFQRSLLRQRAQGKQWSMCGEDLIRDAERAQGSQIWQRVVHPDNALVRIAGGPIAQGTRFHRHHLPAVGREPIGVPP